MNIFLNKYSLLLCMFLCLNNYHLFFSNQFLYDDVTQLKKYIYIIHQLSTSEEQSAEFKQLYKHFKKDTKKHIDDTIIHKALANMFVLFEKYKQSVPDTISLDALFSTLK